MTISNAEKARRATAAAALASGKTAPLTAARQQVESPAIGKPEKLTGRTVVVVCKLPRGLLLQLHQAVRQDVRVVGGGIEKREVAMRVGTQYRLKPATLPFGALPNYPIVDGFSLTRDIPAEFWKAYAAENPKFTMITEGLLAAFDNEVEATAYCREFGKLRHGLEPIEQVGDPRTERSNHQNVSDIDIDTDAPKARTAA